LLKINCVKNCAIHNLTLSPGSECKIVSFGLFASVNLILLDDVSESVLVLKCLPAITTTAQIFVETVWFCDWFCRAVCSAEVYPLITYFIDEITLMVT
jgi:hypothetical protein